MEILDASSRLDLEDLKSLDFEAFGEPSAHNLKQDAAAVREKDADYETSGSE